MPLTNTPGAPAPTQTRPFREGLVSLEPPRLLGSRCGACATTTFPPRAFCPACRAVEGLEQTELDTRGRVHSFTVVRQAPPGVAVPYVLAWVDLPADQVRVMATVVGVEPEAVALDQPVELELTPFATAEDGAELLGFRFRATERGVAA
ncbi:OB-fold domain-containing protein [Pseudonocardia yuanmonensis]|uniref:OB-fold domain-containing protein n=1 Tax=Pseudonocardia yuanmonensis TaxID=1095914 RepID=A0ABP8XLT8_9PSEU